MTDELILCQETMPDGRPCGHPLPEPGATCPDEDKHRQPKQVIIPVYAGMGAEGRAVRDRISKAAHNDDLSRSAWLLDLAQKRIQEQGDAAREGWTWSVQKP